jgi:hypothetical protein
VNDGVDVDVYVHQEEEKWVVVQANNGLERTNKVHPHHHHHHHRD